ncbi:hypothetical protein FDH48_gp48 [Arthrobacter phage Jawnski]|uniref:Uncharacterized protein n=3 Tax=Jawnskivirus TaxID=3425003 RepID=A0A222Z0T3_9CAUD|nr:hypothetical protein FDH47_gp49 [Arthrobacter phage Brent]YP_009601608.1 hypothetical protein FDH48_gp48 [Arthrobacter phage Jawnski]ALF01260.1 hypothetical protein SEA_BRENT_49 [Arthrobacter phage Brent]ALY09377.1 hypothetical protein JAWNSKI_48 [Arthrobacter phage Jawnski]ASR78151.1 hypothetical protein SEA_FRANZY_49 [Arthrobacter phage Franzy]
MNIEVKVTKATATRAIVRFKGGDGILTTMDRDSFRRMAAAAVARHQGDVVGNAQPWKLQQLSMPTPDDVKVELKLSK